MIKNSFNYLFFLLISLPAFPQVASMHASAKPFVSKSTAHEKIEAKKIAPADLNINVLPFFGDFEKNDAQKLKDEEFLKSCDLNFENREEASKFFATRAWEYLGEGQIDTATYRFNLSWMLNKDNVDTYWGLGVISYQKDNLPDAMQFLEYGHQLDAKNVTLVVDLATVKIQCYLKDKDSSDVEIANKLLNEAITIEPTFANGYMKLSLLRIVEGKYSEAWAYLHKAIEIDANSLDIDLLSTLLEKQDDPKGKFKK
jgi:tetratricopeptide (TPR) repeat protein